MFKKGIRFDFWTFVGLLSLVFFGMFLIIPVARMLIYSLQTGDPGKLFSLDNFVKFFSRPYYTRALTNSIKVVLCATVLVTLIGVPLAYIMTMFKIRGAKLINILVVISMLSPPFLGAYSWILMFGRSGDITKLLEQIGLKIPSIYGFGGILLVFVLKLFPYIYMYTKGALKKVDESLNEAAESLGDHGIKRILKVSLPLILPTILAGCTIVFLRAFADYGTPRIIGEGYMTMPVIVYQEWVSETGSNAFFASTAAIIMIFVAAAVFLLQKYITSRKNYTMSMLNPPKPKQLHGAANFFAHFYVYAIAILATLPQFYIIFISFRNTKGTMWAEGYSLMNYVNVFSKSLKSILNTFEFGIIAIIIMVILGTLFAYFTVRKSNALAKVLDVFIMFPYVIPGTIFGLLLLMTYNSPPIVLSGTAAIIIISYVIRRMPYTVRSSAAILRQISPSIDEASASLGYGSMSTFFKVTLPVMVPGVVSGAILSWITTLNELSSTLMLYTGKTQTMTVTVFQEISRGGYGTAAALSTILTVTMVASLMIFFRITNSEDIDL